MTRRMPLAAALIACAMFAAPALAVTCTSAASGNWNVTGTWTGCAGGNGTPANTPGTADTVIVNGGFTVTVPTGTSVNAASLQLGGSTAGSGNGTLSFAASTSALAVSGTVRVGMAATRTGSINMAGGGTLTVPGFTVTNLGTWTPGAGTVVLTATNTLPATAGFATYNNLAVNAGTTSLGRNTTINGALTVAGGAFTVGAFALLVSGATSVTGTLNVTSTTGTKTFTGDVTINGGGTWNETVAEAISFGGSLQNNGTFTSSTGVHTFTGATKTFSGASAIAIPSATISGTYTNNGTLTVATALAGTGSLTNGTNTTLNIGGAATISTLTANATGNLVNYTGAGQTVDLPTAGYYNLTLSGSGAKTMPGTALAVNGDFTMSGTATATTASNLTIGGNLNVGTGTQLTVAGFNIAVTGTTSVTGTLVHSSATGTKTYTGDVTINGTWNETAAAAISFAGSLQNNGTFTSGTGVHTFTGAAKTFSGTNAIAIPSVTVSGTYTNNGTLTVATALAGAGTLTNGATGTLSIGGTSSLATLAATAIGNTVNYNGAAQTIKATIYYNLTLSGIGANPLGGNVTVGGTLTLTSGTLSVGSNTLALNGPAIAGAGAATNLTTTSSSNIVFGGSAAGVSLPGSVTALNSLTINNSSGVTMGGTSVTTVLSGTLALGANTLTTGTNALTLSSDCSANSGNGSITRSSGYVVGNVVLTIPVTVISSTCIYHIGDSIGYAPLTVAVGATTGGGTLTGRVDAGDDPDTIAGASGIDPNKNANHYWTLTAGTLSTSVTYSATFQFCANTGSCVTPTEVDTGASTGNFVVARKLSGSWSTLTTGTRTTYSTQATGIANFGEFAVGEINTCFTDTFTGADGSSPGTNWSVGNKSGAFGNPVIFGNRLRMTDASGAVATWATLQRPFPAAGNKVTVVFQHFAYGGSIPGADGIAVVLSNASVAPAVGAFGGSLGYAQKSNPGSDCTTPGGCPGFAGGWLGIGVDEYGNYSASAEGRNGGSPGLIPESVAARGSGSGMSGYLFLQGTGTLSPAVDGNGTAVPPHVYRITVDHTDGIHGWTSVERDTTGGGTAYVTLIGCAPGQTSGCTALNVLDPGYGQAAVPAFFELSFTGSTGALTNIHEIDNLSVCTVQALTAPTLHHIELDHGGTACTSSPATVTVKACANAACSTLYMNSVTVNLTNIPGATWSTDPVTFAGGQTTVTLSKAATGAVTLGGSATSPTTGNATQCFNGPTQTCTLTFNACTFDAIEVGAAAGTPIFTKLASTAFNLDVLSLTNAKQTANAVDLVDASSGICSTFSFLASTSTAVPSAFTGNQRQTFAFTYNNAAPNVRVRVTTAGPNYSCSTDNFAIRPQAITLTSSATQAGSSGIPVFRAGTDGFSLTATVANNAYTGNPKLNSSLVTSAQANLGTLANVAFPAATGGISTASGFKYSEVGNISFGQYAVYDDTFAQVDSVTGDCTPGFSNTLDVNGKYSCQFGSAAAGPFGRFVPDHFTAAGGIANTCAVGTFTYMAQPFTLSTANVVQAMSGTNGVTRNYVGVYAPGTVSFGAENADNGTNLSARLSFPSGSWSAGIFTLPGTSASFSRPATTVPDATWGPYDSLDIGLTVADPDVTTSPQVSGADMNPSVAGGTSFSYKKFSGSPLRMRFGELRLDNAYGSELLAVRVPVRALYWNGSSWVTNASDSCTGIPSGTPSGGTAGSMVLGNWKGGLALANMDGTHLPVTSVALSGGTGAIVVTRPSGTPPLPTGSVDLALNLGPTGQDANCIGTGMTATGAGLPWLRGNWCGGIGFVKDPNARITFGSSRSPFIYRREMY